MPLNTNLVILYFVRSQFVFCRARGRCCSCDFIFSELLIKNKAKKPFFFIDKHHTLLFWKYLNSNKAKQMKQKTFLLLALQRQERKRIQTVGVGVGLERKKCIQVYKVLELKITKCVFEEISFLKTNNWRKVIKRSSVWRRRPENWESKECFHCIEIDFYWGDPFHTT